MIDLAERLIVALDVPRAEDALALEARLGPRVRWVKVGLELFTAGGPEVVRSLRARGRRVFLDLKLHDIPNTVAGAVRSAARLDVDLLTLHAEGGPEMMEAARDARDGAGTRMRLLAVTMLTSLRGDEYPEVYRSPRAEDRVRAFALAAQKAGLDGVVASPQELSLLSRLLLADLLRVTPGIRLLGGESGDQARIGTPEAAMRAGASHLVVGRPITGAVDPQAVVEDIVAAMATEDPRTTSPGVDRVRRVDDPE